MNPKRLQFDWSINIPMLLSICLILITAVGAFVHVQDQQQSIQTSFDSQQKLDVAIAAQVDRQTQILYIWHDRFRNFPLHKHVGNQIIYAESDPEEELIDPPPAKDK